jgi:predicted NACHT family NTPase
MKGIESYLKAPINELISEFSAEIKQVVSNRLLEYQTEEYNRNLYSKTLLFRTQPKRLYDFYLPLILEKYETKIDINKRTKLLKRYISKEGKLKSANKESFEIMEHFLKENVSVSQVKTESIKEFFKEGNYLTIIGDAGSGKSTLVKYLFIKSVEDKFKIPIKIELRYLNTYEGSLIKYITNEVFKFHDLGKSDRIIERLLESGKFLFFLDGYDEVSSNVKEKLTKDIDEFVKRYNDNLYLLTSRPFADIELLPLFHNYKIADLSDNEIMKFVKKQIPTNEKELAEKIIASIQQEENQSYKSFLRNPLLLSMFILTFQSYSNIPQKKSIFYQQVFDTLYSVHDSVSKMAFVREKESGLSKDQFERILQMFSFLAFFEEKYSFEYQYIIEKLKIIKNNTKEFEFENSKLLKDLLVSIAILSKEGTEYKFPHRSLQEYFAAYYVSVLSKENKQVLYNKMLNEFSKSDFSDLILSKSKGDNFLSLLYEMDRIELLKSLIVPALERVNNDLTSSEFKEIKINVKHCLSALINNYVFLQRIKVVTKSSDTQKEFEKFFKALTETSGGIHLLVSGKEKEKEKKLEVNTKNEKKYAILFAGIENLNVYIKEFTNKKVIEFKQEIKDFEQGEFDLVSMVK